MTPREQLIQEVLQAPDSLVSALLKLLRLVSAGQVGIAHRLAQLVESFDESASVEDDRAPALIYKDGALVVGGELSENLDVNQFISDLREERIQEQMGL